MPDVRFDSVTDPLERAQNAITALQIGMTATPKNVGGVDRYYFNLVPALAEYGVATEGLVVGESDTMPETPYVHTFAAESDGLLARMRKLRRVAAPLLPSANVVVSHFAPYTVSLLDRLGKKPLVTHFHGPWAGESEAEGAGRFSVAAKKQVELLVYRKSARTIVLSQSFADIAMKDYGIPADRIRIVPGGVQISRFAPVRTRAEARAHLGWPIDRPTVVTVRRLVQAKGIENLIAAAALLRERTPDIFVAIVGTGPLAERLQTAIDEANLRDNVRLMGHAAEADLPSIYRAADLFVVPTIALEGFGLVVVEALASGTPTLVTPIGGLPEVVRPLDPSLVFASIAPHHLALGIGRALSGATTLPSEAECIAYADRFRWSEIAGRIAAVYREVV